MTKNQLQYWDQQEKIRSNLVNEAENKRSHLANEAIQTRLAEIGALQAQAALQNASTNSSSLAETVRSNKAKEFEAMRTNMAKEFETHRSNVAKENLEQQLRDIQRWTNRSEDKRIAILGQQAAIAAGQLNELIRSNQERERQNLISLDEVQRANQAREAETERSNKQQEALQSLSVLYNRLNKLTDADIAAANLSQTEIRDLNNLKLGLYGLMLEAGKVQNQSTSNLIEAGKLGVSSAKNVKDVLNVK